MIDPSDILNLYRDGDEGVLPTPTGGHGGLDVDGDIDLSEGGTPPPIARVFDLSIPTTVTKTVSLRDRPDYWVVAMSSAANGALRVWPAEAPAGAPYRLEPGGEAIIPGTGRFLTMTADGAVTHVVTVVAVRGYEGVRIRVAK